MLLSVVLVNYKVPQLTIEAVRSVLASSRRLDGEVEVIVLDNASGDDSMTRLRTAFGAELDFSPDPSRCWCRGDSAH